MNDYRLDLEKLIPVSRPDLNTLVCRLGGTGPIGPKAPVITLRKSLDRFECRLTITVTIAGRDVRVHHADMTPDDTRGWCSLEQSMAGIEQTQHTQVHQAAVALLTDAGVFPKFPLK